ncbi:hypothetical protein Lal_00014318 [Lupinus albus]|nr:hypothetical protein Lal_00014318 [Lupinus albus]
MRCAAARDAHPLRARIYPEQRALRRSRRPGQCCARRLCAEVTERRSIGLPTVPMPLDRELACNPFLRADDPALQARWGGGDAVATLCRPARRQGWFSMSASDSPAPARTAASRGTSPRRLARVTSFDVAEAAGVSQSTVSRALAGDPSISAPTRERVTEAARRLNYQVDENAARLRRGKTGTLAVVMDSQANFWGHYQERRKADGMIVIGTSENTEAGTISASCPRAAIGSAGARRHDDFPWVRSDNHAGAALATRHMLVRGYRRIVCLGSETSPQRQFKERYDGYAAAMESAGLEPVLQRIERGLPREEQGRRATAALIDSGQPFDGLFGVSDEIALGALKELAMRGIAVPDQVGVVGFDGVRAGAWSTPPLTTVESDFEVAGSLLVDRLLGVIAGETTTARRVPVRMVHQRTGAARRSQQDAVPGAAQAADGRWRDPRLSRGDRPAEAGPGAYRLHPGQAVGHARKGARGVSPRGAAGRGSRGCHMIASNFDYLLKIRTADILAYRRVLGEHISSLPNVASTSTYVAMETIIEHGA